jgi:hypothetical protein
MSLAFEQYGPAARSPQKLCAAQRKAPIAAAAELGPPELPLDLAAMNRIESAGGPASGPAAAPSTGARTAASCRKQLARSGCQSLPALPEFQLRTAGVRLTTGFVARKSPSVELRADPAAGAAKCIFPCDDPLPFRREPAITRPGPSARSRLRVVTALDRPKGPNVAASLSKLRTEDQPALRKLTPIVNSLRAWGDPRPQDFPCCAALLPEPCDFQRRAKEGGLTAIGEQARSWNV